MFMLYNIHLIWAIHTLYLFKWNFHTILTCAITLPFQLIYKIFSVRHCYMNIEYIFFFIILASTHLFGVHFLNEPNVWFSIRQVMNLICCDLIHVTFNVTSNFSWNFFDTLEILGKSERKLGSLRKTLPRAFNVLPHYRKCYTINK